MERILLPAFDSWRSGGEDATSVVGIVVGTLDWMFHEYRQTWSQKTAKRLQALQKRHQSARRLWRRQLAARHP
jgi:hypothetical protein